jgi:predicted dehydrogenase
MHAIAIIGLGQGLSHLQAFQMLPDCRVVAVCDADQALAQRIALQYNVATVHPHIDAVLSDRSIDAVVIATPDHLHGQHAIMALQAGKHVLCEIPMALTIAECQQIITFSERHGLTYQMGNQVRYAACLTDIAALLRAGDLGPIFYGEGEYLHDYHDIVDDRPADHWRIDPVTPQTTLLGGGPHALDTLRWLMGVRYVEAQAYHVSIPSEWHTTHTTVALLKADSGAVSKVTVSYGMQRPYCLYYSVYGSAGSFERSRDQGSPMAETTNYYSHRKLSGARRLIPATVPNWYNPRLPRSMMLGHGTMEVEQAQRFVAAIAAHRPADINTREAADSIVPLICALQSADQGGGVVHIPELEVRG